MALDQLFLFGVILTISSHLSHNRVGRWGTTDDFATSFVHFSLFSTALWDLANSRSVHCLMSSHLFLSLPCLLPLSLCLARWFLPDLINGRHDHTTAVCVSQRWSGGFRVIQLLLDLGTDFLVGNMVFVGDVYGVVAIHECSCSTPTIHAYCQ